MPRSFHVVRETVTRAVLLCHAESEESARTAVLAGDGETIDTDAEVNVVSVEETAHSKRRRGLAKVARLPAVLMPELDGLVDEEGAQGDEPISTTAPHAPSPLREVESYRQAIQEAAEGHWRTLQPGQIPQAGDRYRLRETHPWEPVPQSLIGHAISREARAQFQTRSSL